MKELIRQSIINVNNEIQKYEIMECKSAEQQRERDEIINDMKVSISKLEKTLANSYF